MRNIIRQWQQLGVLRLKRANVLPHSLFCTDNYLEAIKNSGERANNKLMVCAHIKYNINMFHELRLLQKGRIFRVEEILIGILFSLFTFFPFAPLSFSHIVIIIIIVVVAYIHSQHKQQLYDVDDDIASSQW
jgi:hypothetical protein